MNTETEATTYAAVVAYAADLVAGDHCDMTVIQREIIAERGEYLEIPVYAPTGPAVTNPAELPTRVDAAGAGDLAVRAADDALTASGWIRTGDWEDAGTAVYATVKPAAYTAAVQAATPTGAWQALHPAEPISGARFDGPEDAAAWIAANQLVATGTGWRVAVWIGVDADTAGPTAATYNA